MQGPRRPRAGVAGSQHHPHGAPQDGPASSLLCRPGLAGAWALRDSRRKMHCQPQEHSRAGGRPVAQPRPGHSAHSSHSGRGARDSDAKVLPSGISSLPAPHTPPCPRVRAVKQTKQPLGPRGASAEPGYSHGCGVCPLHGDTGGPLSVQGWGETRVSRDGDEPSDLVPMPPLTWPLSLLPGRKSAWHCRGSRHVPL